MIETIVLSFSAQLKVVVTIAIFLAIYFEFAKYNQLLGFLAGFGFSYLVYTENTWYVLGMFILAFYFGYHIIKTIRGNIKDFFGL